MQGWYLYFSNKVDSLLQELPVMTSQTVVLPWGKL